MSKLTSTKQTKSQQASLDAHLNIHFGQGTTAIDIVDFINRKFSYLNSTLMMIQSNQLLENEGGCSATQVTKDTALMSAIDSLAELNGAWDEYNRVQEAAS